MKLLATDYDGTLRQAMQVETQVVEAVRQFRQAGHCFGVVSGRCIDMIETELKGQKIPYDFIIGNNGATAMDSCGKLLFNTAMPFVQAKQIIEICLKQSWHHLGISDGVRYFSGSGYERWLLPSLLQYEYQLIDLKSLLDARQIASIFMIFNTLQEAEATKAQLTEYTEGLTLIHDDLYLEIACSGVNKYFGVSKMVQQFHCNEVYVIGDDFNDLSMIKGFQGFAVSRAKEEVKEAASGIFLDVKECIEFIGLE